MRALITGITGFVGSHLADYLLESQSQVRIFGTKRWRSPKDNIKHIEGQVKLCDCDLRDLSSLQTMLQQIEPDVIFHLAAQSYVPTSFAAPTDTYEANIIGTSNLLEAVRLLKQNPVIHICSSSEVYGQVSPDEIPITENCLLRPASPYAVSKVGEDMVAYYYHQAWGLKTIRSRMFTHTGPRRGSVFALSAFAKQIAQIEAGLQDPPLKVGNLNSVRTWMDVRDAVKAYWLLVQKCTPGEVYNIGGDYTCTIGDALEKLISFSDCLIPVEVDVSLLRPKDVTLQIPDTTKFREATGWAPQITFAKTCEDILNYWRAEVGDFWKSTAKAY